MKVPERRFRLALLRQQISRQQLANAVGLKPTTLGNIIRGGRCSATTRRKITQFLRTTIWRDTPLVRELLLGPDIEIESPTVGGAIELARQFPRGLTTRHGKTIHFTRPFTVAIERGLASK